MTNATVVWRNVWRNKVRTYLTVGSVAVSLFLFTMLRAVVDSMGAVAASSASQLRLVVCHKTTMTKVLPLGHGSKIAALPGVRAVCAVRWFGGRLESSSEQFPSLAAEPATMPVVYSDFELREDEIAAWLGDRTAAVIGSGLARRMRWTPGQRVVLRSTIPPYLSLEFCVVAVTAAQAYPNVFAFRLDYLTDALRADGRTPPESNDAVHFFWVKAASPDALDSLPAAIDALFARSPDPTRTEPEESFVAQFTKMFGDIPRILGAVGIVVAASILFVVGNTMSMSIRERARELAVLKAIGFSSRRILAMVVGESVFLGFVGSVIGCVSALVAFGRSPDAGLSMPYFPVIAVSPITACLGVAVGAIVGLLAGLGPTRYVARLSATSTLRDEA